MFLRCISLLFFLAVCFWSSAGHAEVEHCANFPSDPACRTGQPEGALPKSSVTIKPDSGNKPMNPRGMYRIEFKCSSKGTVPVDTTGLFSRLNVASSLLVAVSDQNTGTTPTPTTSKAMLSIYNVGGPSTNRNSYINEACGRRAFFLAPRQPLYLIGASSYVETREVGPALKFVEGAISIVSSIWPLFTGLPIPANPGNQLKAINSTDPAIQSFLSVFNNGLTDLKSPALTEGHTAINAQFATVHVYVTALRSIVGLNNEQFKVDLETMLESMAKLNITGASDNTAIAAACSAAENSLQTKNNLSREDIAYSMVYLARNAGLLNAQQFIRCLGRDYALIAAKNFVDGLDDARKFDEATVKTVLPDIPTTPQPEFRAVQFRMNRLMGELGAYAAQNPLPSFEQSLLAKNDMAPTVQIDDATGISRTSSGTIPSVDLLSDLKAQHFTRFGCIMPDNDSLMFFLILPERPAQPDKGFKFSEVRLARGWLNQDTKLARLELTAENNQIAAVVNYNKGGCGAATFAEK
jgi:hypothetical protein